MIDDHLYSFLTNQSSITDLVSTRIYPQILPQEPVYPAITFRQDSHDYEETFEGQGGMTDSYYSIDAWAKTFAEAMSIGNVVRNAMQNTVGEFGGINIHRCIVSNGPISVYEDEVEGYRQTHVFLIRHNEG